LPLAANYRVSSALFFGGATSATIASAVTSTTSTISSAIARTTSTITPSETRTFTVSRRSWIADLACDHIAYDLLRAFEIRI
jgi:hypothetical protein